MPDTPLVVSLAAAFVSLLSAGGTIWMGIRKAATDRELQSHRSRLDQLDRLHSRRVEQIEKLYAAIEAAVEGLPLQQPDPNEIVRGHEAVAPAKTAHGNARIYLPDDVDRLCLDLFEDLARAWSAIEVGEHFEMHGVNQIPEEALREIRGLKTASEGARRIRDELRVALRGLLGIRP